MESPIQTIRNKGRRVRGYRIHIFRGAGHHPPSLTMPTIWAEQPPLQKWRDVIADPATQSAYIIRSGRKMREFQFRRGA
jgi:hypothetical protein